MDIFTGQSSTLYPDAAQAHLIATLPIDASDCIAVLEEVDGYLLAGTIQGRMFVIVPSESGFTPREICR